MPLPFIILGAAVLAGGFGVKKGFDAKSDYSRAGDLADRSNSIYEDARSLLDDARIEVRGKLEYLGKQKLLLYEDGLIPFVSTFQKIKNIDFNDPDLTGDLKLNTTEADMLDVQDVTIKMVDVLKGGVASITGGTLVGVGAYGGAGAFAAASTGTLISGLSGVAATNATLAWFGGGSLAAGGWGMAGGTAVLGGIVAGPVLAVGGMMLAYKAGKAVEDARANFEKATAAAEVMNTARVVARGIQRRVEEIAGVLLLLKDRLLPEITDLESLVAKDDRYPNYSLIERTQVMRCAAIAKTAKNVMESPLLTKSGSVTRESRRIVKEAQLFIKKLDEM